jgi:hypothetical protein
MSENQGLQRIVGGQSVTLKNSLTALAQSRKQRPIILLDISGSMGEAANGEARKIDLLRELVFSLREKTTFDQAVFDTGVEWTDDVPEPRGSTALHLALDEAAQRKARRYVLITDGQPDSQELAMEAATRLGAPLDVFYVGPAEDMYAQQFLHKLATAAKGLYNQADLAATAQLENKVMLALNPASDEDIKRGPIAL